MGTTFAEFTRRKSLDAGQIITCPSVFGLGSADELFITPRVKWLTRSHKYLRYFSLFGSLRLPIVAPWTVPVSDLELLGSFKLKPCYSTRQCALLRIE